MRLIKLNRFYDNQNETVGKIEIDNELICFTLEDEFRKNKVRGETRIPAGLYQIKLRNSGSINEKYKKYPWHKGMLWLQDVPNFTYIYIHKGNTEKDTLGCILVGDSLRYKDSQLTIGSGTSSTAYERLYKLVIEDALSDNLFIKIS